jgi:hypothetical protein
MAKWVNEGENRVLDILVGSQAVDSALYLGLYTDSSEPGETATLSTITEVNGAGYARKTLARGSWTIADDLATFAKQTFTASGVWGQVTGYFIGTSSNNTGKLLAVESFAEGSFNMVNGSVLGLVPKLRVA